MQEQPACHEAQRGCPRLGGGHRQDWHPVSLCYHVCSGLHIRIRKGLATHHHSSRRHASGGHSGRRHGIHPHRTHQKGPACIRRRRRRSGGDSFKHAHSVVSLRRGGPVGEVRRQAGEGHAVWQAEGIGHRRRHRLHDILHVLHVLAWTVVRVKAHHGPGREHIHGEALGGCRGADLLLLHPDGGHDHRTDGAWHGGSEQG
mmetsp:Transcript_36334/g.85257  ORF Transcript_36334/g.85257 Transcript_36334/m.85257 type:complete len:201 (-) Transcript_36334:239-841(-)